MRDSRPRAERRPPCFHVLLLMRFFGVAALWFVAICAGIPIMSGNV